MQEMAGARWPMEGGIRLAASLVAACGGYYSDDGAFLSIKLGTGACERSEPLRPPRAWQTLPDGQVSSDRSNSN